jgi:glycosyltransferase involved in cell wall biosynthesis
LVIETAMTSHIDSRTRVVLVGHPFIPIGMGEHLRCSFRSFQSIGMNVGIKDIFGSHDPDSDLNDELKANLVEDFGSDLNIFHINGDEVQSALKHLGTDLPGNAHNVIYPMWELSKYPEDWAIQLNRFDEIWAPSKFTYGSIEPAVERPVFHLPVTGQLQLKSFLGRRYFKIPESSFTFLFFFDLTSYIERKNPFAVLDAFEKLCRLRPDEDICLVIKLKGGEMKHQHNEALQDYLSRLKGKLIVIDRLLTDNEMKNLLRCSDCFVSLHRSEGYGLGLINAMFLAKPVIATAYSANMDFMNESNSCLVRYDLCPVPDGAYPFNEGQVWANGDVDHAVEHMLRLVSDHDFARRIGDEASRHVRIHFSYRATGLRYTDRLNEIADSHQPRAPKAQTYHITGKARI